VNPLDASSVISSTGLIGIFLVLVAETGLLVGFFLPGDSLLFTAGLLAATSGSLHLPLPAVLAVSVVGALVGAQIGYWIGRTAGAKAVDRSDRPAIRRGTERVGEVIDRYGIAKAIVIARFIPVVRTVMNPMAGVLRVPVRQFTLWQVVGGVLWTVGVVIAGYFLGRHIPGIDQYLLPIIVVVVAISVIPIGVEFVRDRRRRRGGTDMDASATDCSTAGTGGR
jgi:membrane-associated protein